jgi:hypothetical protein
LNRLFKNSGPGLFFRAAGITTIRAGRRYRLAEVLPLEGEQKQSLLALRDDGERLERLRAYLQRAA